MTNYTAMLENILQPGNYGFAQILVRPIERDIFGSHFIRGIARLDPSHYDCLSAAINIRDKLREQGIHSVVWKGRDEFGLWDGGHFFVETSDGIILDKTPPYATEGAQHIKIEKLTDAQIDAIKESNEIAIGKGQMPLAYHQVSPERAYVSRLGVTGLKSPLEEALNLRDGHPNTIDVVYDITEIANGQPTRAYSITYRIDKNILTEAERSGKIENRYALNVEDMIELGAITSIEQGFGLNLIKPGELNVNGIDLSVVTDMRGVAQGDMGVVRQFTLNVINPSIYQNRSDIFRTFTDLGHLVDPIILQKVNLPTYS